MRDDIAEVLYEREDESVARPWGLPWAAVPDHVKKCYCKDADATLEVFERWLRERAAAIDAKGFFDSADGLLLRANELAALRKPARPAEGGR